MTIPCISCSCMVFRRMYELFSCWVASRLAVFLAGYRFSVTCVLFGVPLPDVRCMFAQTFTVLWLLVSLRPALLSLTLIFSVLPAFKEKLAEP